ncbi:MAG: hypothetical protein NC132_03130 [Corallococcus sp.]|nr:hypothetical protein [Corallococcus sp.]MCM1359100.1 hypothetical protein [Corallococcus sp.]MCM1395089.1 hypothetical protein [Corallococcus sp.]
MKKKQSREVNKAKQATKRSDKPVKKAAANKKTVAKQAAVKNKTAATKAASAPKKPTTSTKSKSATKKKEVKTVSITIKSLPDSQGGHIHFILDNLEDNHVTVGITHDKYKGKNHPNIPLEVNPTGGTEQSYMKRQGTVAEKKRYTDEQKGKISKSDLSKAVHIGEKAKQKHLNKTK